MLVSRCCKDNLILDKGCSAFYRCEKCYRPTEAIPEKRVRNDTTGVRMPKNQFIGRPKKTKIDSVEK